jgi:hypothetical protein
MKLTKYYAMLKSFHQLYRKPARSQLKQLLSFKSCLLLTGKLHGIHSSQKQKSQYSSRNTRRADLPNKGRGKDADCERLTQTGTIVKMKTKPIKNIYVTYDKIFYNNTPRLKKRVRNLL